MATKRHEITGVLLFMAAAIALICLISYDSRDSSLNALFRTPDAQNLAGRVGAYVSDFLFQAFGLAAYLLVLPLFVLSWKLIRGREITSPYLRAVGVALLVISISATLQVLPISLKEVNYMPGGVVGVLVGDLLFPNLNMVGSLIVLTAIFVLGILAATTFSLGKILERTAQKGTVDRPGLWERYLGWRQKRKSVRRVVSIRQGTQPSIEPPPAVRPAPVKAPLPPPAAPEPLRPPIAKPIETEPSGAPSAEARPRGRKFTPPPIDLLSPPEHRYGVDEADLMEKARLLAEKCAEFDVHGSITQIHPGPVVTTFEFKPDAGIKYSRITSLVDDLCLGVKAESIRIDRIPGKATVGIEIPNTDRETIVLREMIESDVFRKSSSRLTLALGKLINGNVYVTDLGKMPHLLIAGATGAGKSVALNCMIASIIYKASPEEVKFILIDPKRLELGVYADIPYLLTPIVTDPKEAANVLRWATNEMEIRYKKLAKRGVRNIEQYNSLLRSTAGRQLSLIESNETEGEPEAPLPYLVLVIDELADLMVVSSREVEESISRLAAMARAVGIHLVLATQRPSVDVITGVIKANFPCRIAFKVASKVDSRTIIDANGAEQLLGNGDMLFIPPSSARLLRIHGAFLGEKEAQAIVEHLQKQGRPQYNNTVLAFGQEVDEAGNPIEAGEYDSLYVDAVRIVVSEGRASTSLLQRRLSIGYGRAAKLIDIMHENGLVGPAEGSRPREVLVGLEYLDRLG